MDEKRLTDESISKIEKTKIEKNRKRGRKPGTPKTGGRKKGSLNKANSTWNEIIQAESFCIPTEAIGLFMQKTTPPNLKLQILQFLAQYTVSAIKPKDEPTEPQKETSNEPADILSLVTNDK